MHACALQCPSILTKFSMFFSGSAGSGKNKWLKITTPTTLCLTCVITLQIHHSTEPTKMPALLYSFHIKKILQNLK